MIASNTWIAPSVVGVPPAPRAGHSAVFVGKKLIVFGGVGMDNEEYDDLYMLDTGTNLLSLSACIGKNIISVYMFSCQLLVL